MRPFLDFDLGLTRAARKWEFSLRTSARFLAVEGPSGVGKTTWLRTLAGLEPHATGRLRVERTDWQTESGFVPAWERHAGWVPQDSLLFPHLDVARNLGYSGQSTPNEIRAVAHELGLAELFSRRARDLSGGERQRVSLGRALLAQPRLLLLDEPFSALDEERRLSLMRWLRAHCERRMIGLVIVTHHADECSALCDARYRMSLGGELRPVAAVGREPVPEVPVFTSMLGRPFHVDGMT
jgi:molybdate transport system ATP-binding protein